MPLPDPLTTSGIVLAQRAVQTVAQSSLVDSVRNGVVDFLTKQVQDLGKKELADRIAGMRSDAKLRSQIQTAIEHATKRWAEDYPDRDLVLTVASAHGTEFADLPSVQAAVQAIARNPLNPVPVETLRGKFAEVLPKRFEPERTERGVVAWLEILREEFVGVSDLRQALAVAAEIQTARSTGLAAEVLLRLDDTLRHMETGPTPTEQTLRDYLHWVIDQHYYLDPRGTMQTVRQVQVRLQDVYVSLEAEAQAPLSILDRRLFEHELEGLMEHDDLMPEAKEDLRENLLARYAMEEARVDTRPVELAELVRKHARLVILGDPGAGKTTLLRYLALRHAQALRDGEPEMPDLGSVRLPIYFRIANYAEQNDGRSLVDYIPTCVRGEEDADPAIAVLVRERLDQGKCLVLLDGLDEVIEPSQRAEIAAQIDALIRTHERTGNRFVVTSRVAGYRTAPLAGDLPHYCVRDMNDEQVLRFLQLWCNAVERFQTPELAPEAQALKAQAEIDDIMKAIQDNPGVRRLATNPLLLRVLALIHRSGARLPQRRIELYRLAADTLIRDWELARGIPQAALVREADANRLLAELAAWMHQEKPAGIATEGEVKAQLANVVGQLQGKEPDHPDVQSAVDDFLVRIRQHTGLFVERAPRRCGFMHLTFEEYFAARWLVARPREAARRIRNRLHHPRWEEPILLAIGFYGMEFPDDVDELVEEAILGKNLGGSSPYEDILHRDLLFAVRVLGDQDVSPRLRERLVVDLFSLWLNWSEISKYGPLQSHIYQTVAAIKSSQAALDLRDTLLEESVLECENAVIRSLEVCQLGNFTDCDKVVDALLVALQDGNPSVRMNAIQALGTKIDHPRVITALLPTLTDKDEHVRTYAIAVLGRAIEQPSVTAAMLNALNDEEKGTRFDVALALGKSILSSDATTTLLSRLKGDHSLDPNCVAFALGKSSHQAQVTAVLLDALTDDSEEIRSAAAVALVSSVSRPEVSTALLVALKNESSNDIRGAIAVGLGHAIDQPIIVAALLAALNDEKEDVRTKAAQALSDATVQPEVVTALLTALGDESEIVRAEAAWALHTAVNQQEVITALLAALDDDSDLVYLHAIRALCQATVTPKVVDFLITAAQDGMAGVRYYAVEALGNAATQPEVVLVLLAALKDESEIVRLAAAKALSSAAAQPEVVTSLLAALQDRNGDVRASASNTLTQLVQRPRAKLPTDLAERLIESLKLSGLEGINVWSRGTPRDRLFDALMAVAPGPTVP